MPRPSKKRRVCSQPTFTNFCSHQSSNQVVYLTYDEYESLRLIDYEMFTQDECAKMMNVARTTITAIYASARQKVATCLVLGHRLEIIQGDVEFCEDYQENFKCRKACLKHYPKKSVYLLDEKEKSHMRIAITYKDGDVFQHFGRSEFFKIYDVKDGQIITTAIIPTMGNGHGALGNFLKEAKVDALICGGIGAGARNVLNNVGINIYPGVNGNADEAIKAFIAGNLNFDANTECHDHDHEGHDCGSHGCGSHCH